MKPQTLAPAPALMARTDKAPAPASLARSYMDAAASPAAAGAPKPRQVLTPVLPPPGGKPARQRQQREQQGQQKLLVTGIAMPPAYSRRPPGSASGACPADYVREVVASRDQPGGTYAWGRAHLEHAARVLGVQAKSKKALVLAVDAEVDRRRAPGGAGAGLRP